MQLSAKIHDDDLSVCLYLMKGPNDYFFDASEYTLIEQSNFKHKHFKHNSRTPSNNYT